MLKRLTTVIFAMLCMCAAVFAVADNKTQFDAELVSCQISEASFTESVEAKFFGALPASTGEDIERMSKITDNLNHNHSEPFSFSAGIGHGEPLERYDKVLAISL